MKRLIVLLILLILMGCSSRNQKLINEFKSFQYTPAGVLIPKNSGIGRRGDNYIYAPNIRFPLETAPAYINSQVYGVGGMYGKSGSLCNKENYKYPWHDNYCEKRSWNMPLCPSGRGHQGVDIRPATCHKDKYFAVAVEQGLITYIGRYSVYLRGESGRTYRYLHLNSKRLQVKIGQKVKRGQRIGLVSDNMGDTKTSIHLHFDVKETLLINGYPIKVYIPIYTSLVEAYKRLLNGNP